MKQPIHNISWLTSDTSKISLGGSTEKLKVKIPMPAEIGEGFSEHLHLPSGILLIQTKIIFNRAHNSLPHVIPYGTFSTEFPSDVFFSHIIHKGQMDLISKISDQSSSRNSKFNLFAFNNKFEIEQHVYTEEDLAYTAIAIPKKTLISLVGDDMYSLLIKTLGLSESANPIATEIAIPNYISDILKNVLPNSLQNDLRVFHAKTKVLQYLSDVSLYLNSSDIFLGSHKSSTIAEQLFEYLRTLEGNIPTLMELSQKFGVNAIKLNNIFLKKYNESIYSFIINHRLLQAHQAITSSSLSLKTISFRIGYSNVNNFTAAFKKKYGITPGILRKNSL
jgi:AraC-like DNA-binding protein